ncbi:alpha/beta-hydrolase [Trichoderma gracile]
MKFTCTLLSGLALANGATVHQQKLPTVDLGYQIHRAISFDEHYETYNFTNIPYAEPPLGPLRFTAPVPPKGRKLGVQDGSVGKVCPQANPNWLALGEMFTAAYGLKQLPFNVTLAKEDLSQLPPPSQDDRINEDCLVLDVLVPKKVFDKKRDIHKRGPKPTKGAPVLVWIYGGGYVIGDKSMFGTPSELMAASRSNGQDGAIWVAMNYRLGAFGFLSGPTLQHDGGTPNAGLLDQRLALEWVQEHIHLFGGDPDNVTIMGVSAGGGSIMHHITAWGGSKPAPFRRAIPQSAGIVPVPGNREQEQTFNEFLALLNVSTLNEARALPSSELMAANLKQVAAAPYGAFSYGPVVDGTFVPGMPSKLFLQGAFAKDIEIFSTYNSHEGIIFTDPSAFNDESLLRKQLGAIFTSFTSEDYRHVFETLYPAKYDGSQPYTDTLGRAQLIIAEAALICNQNSMIKAAQEQGVAAFGFQNSIWPAVHGGDQPYLFSNGPTPGVDAQIASVAKDAIAGFVINGSPIKSSVGGISIPPYGRDDSILNFVANASSVIRDPTSNNRCDWWQKALYY